MSVSESDIARVAELARIRLDENEIPELTNRMQTILSLIDQMQAVNTDQVAIMSNPLDAVQRLRADSVTEHDQRDAFQSLAPACEQGLYLVPKVID